MWLYIFWKHFMLFAIANYFELYCLKITYAYPCKFTPDV